MGAVAVGIPVHLLSLILLCLTSPGCDTIKQGSVEITAYDDQGRALHHINAVVTNTASLYVSLNWFCLAYPRSRVIARPKDGSKPVEYFC
jgi:hypothetical protein